MPRVLLNPPGSGKPPEPGETVVRRTKTTTYSSGRAWLPWVAGMLLVPLALAWLYLYPFGGRDRIQDDLTAKARDALAAAQIPNAGVKFNGADASLCGVPDNMYEQAEITLTKIEGVHSVKAASCGPVGGGSNPVAGTKKGALSLGTSAGRVVLAGVVPDEATRTQLLDAAKQAAGGKPIDNQLNIQAGALLPVTAAELGKLAVSLGDVPGDHQLAWDGTTLKLTGSVPAETDKAALEQQIKQLAPSVTLENQLSVSSPGTLNATVVNGHLVLSGSVPDEATKQALLESTRATAGGMEVDDQLAIQSGSTLPAEAGDVGKLLGALATTPGSSQLAWDGTKLTLTGTVPTEADKTALEQQIKEIVPGVELDNQLTVTGSPQPSETPQPSATPQAGALSDQARQELQDQIDAAIAAGPVNFLPDTATLSPQGQLTMGQIAALLLAAPDAQIEIDGHVAAVQSPADGQALSQQRADAVKALLIAAGVSGAKITAKGFGDTKPVAGNDTPLGQAQNRRVEITVR